MALKSDFYNEIFANEEKWIELINKNLLNSIYCNLTLRPFYVQKRNDIEIEYKLTNNQILGQILLTIDNIIAKIDYFNEQYKNSKFVDIKSLLPMLLINRMNNTNQKDSNDRLEMLKEQKQALEKEILRYNKSTNDVDDYIFDEFSDDYKKAM